MFYKATHTASGNMWDVWLWHHEDTYYLYSLCKSGKEWDNISMARSPDGVHWVEIGPVLSKASDVTWMGTGSTWKNPVAGAKPAFQLNYSLWKGERQTIFFAQSDDLVNWTPCGPQQEFVQDERWYERNGRWDCIWTMPRPEGGLYGYWTATPKPGTGAVFGFGESVDGITWKALEPPKVSAVGVDACEVGAIEKVGDRYFMLIGTHFKHVNGHMQVLVADKPQGPFRQQTRNQYLLGGWTILKGHWICDTQTYFARFFQSSSGLLVCHHAIERGYTDPFQQVHVGLLKGTDIDADGTLRLTWWPGNEALKHQPVAVSSPNASATGPILMLDQTLDAEAGFLLEGTIELPRALAAPRGLFIEHGKNTGAIIQFYADGRAELGVINVDGSGYELERMVNRDRRFKRQNHFRLLLKGSLLEIYLEDFLMECFSLRAGATGRIGLVPGDKRNSIRALKAWK